MYFQAAWRPHYRRPYFINESLTSSRRESSQKGKPNAERPFEEQLLDIRWENLYPNIPKRKTV